jgi:predicted neuraminidase
MRPTTILAGIACALNFIGVSPLFAAPPGLVSAQFIYQQAPFPECHASTIEQTPQGIVAAWFGGTAERNPDVCIWMAHYDASSWSEPVQVADGIQSADLRYPCWNPVLYQVPDGPLLLFYKVGPSPSAWWGMVKSSTDHGQTWSEAQRIAAPHLGPIKNKPIPLADGTILCGSSDESDGWIVYMETCDRAAENWTRSAPLNAKTTMKAIQPTILRYSAQRLQILCRTDQEVMAEAWSDDDGRSWTQLTAASLPNPNAGFDGVTLRDGRQLLVYNHAVRRGAYPSGREVLNVATSRNGQQWQAVMKLEQHRDSEYSYPAVMQAADGKVHITYTYRRERIKHVVLDPDQLVEVPMQGGDWPDAGESTE